MKEHSVRLAEATGLDQLSARTALYWAGATYGVAKLNLFPILAIRGPMGTGKTTVLEILRAVAHEPGDGLIAGQKTTYAALRDKMASTATIMVDEADSIHEELFLARYSKTSAGIDLKTASGSRDWDLLAVNVFGATAVHQRQPFQDAAVESRAIVLKTVPKAEITPMDGVRLTELRRLLQSVAREVDWSAAKFGYSRERDTWEPLLLVARSVGDEEWLTYAKQRIADATDALLKARNYEPLQLAYLALLRLSISDDGTVGERVELAHVRTALEADGGDFNSWQVSRLLQDAGLTVDPKGGRTWVYTGGEDNLKSIGRELNIEDAWLDE